MSDCPCGEDACPGPDGRALCDPAPSFTCPRCEAVSYHPRDIEFGYCGACHEWTGDGA